MSTVKSKKLQVGTDASASNNFTIYQPATPDGTLRIGVGNAENPTEVAQFHSSGITMASGKTMTVSGQELIASPIMERRYISSAATISHATTTTLDFATEDFANPSSIYDSGTNTFTPTRAGYYEIYFQAMLNNTNTPYRFMTYIFRNSGSLSRGYISTASGTEIFGITNTTAIAYFNGSTDTFDFRVLAYESSSNSLEIMSSTNSTYMQYKYLGDF